MATLFLLLSSLFPADSARAFHVEVARAESLWVTDRGDGDAVVFIPGLFGSAYSFRQVLSVLAERGHRAIAIEPLGIGFSGKPEKANYSLTSQADRIALVLRQLGVEHAILVGHSVGASVAYRVAYRHPELVAGVVSVEGGPAESIMTPGARAAVRFIPWVKWMGGMKLIRGRIRKGLIESSADSGWVTDEVVSGYTDGAAVDLDETLKSLLAMSRAREPEKLKPHLGEISVPVMLLVGSNSKGGIPKDEIRLLQTSLPAFSADTVAGAGLYIQEEQPQAIVEKVEALLAATAMADRGQ